MGNILISKSHWFIPFIYDQEVTLSGALGYMVGLGNVPYFGFCKHKVDSMLSDAVEQPFHCFIMFWIDLYFSLIRKE